MFDSFRIAVAQARQHGGPTGDTHPPAARLKRTGFEHLLSEASFSREAAAALSRGRKPNPFKLAWGSAFCQDA